MTNILISGYCEACRCHCLDIHSIRIVNKKSQIEWKKLYPSCVCKVHLFIDKNGFVRANETHVYPPSCTILEEIEEKRRKDN